MEIISELGPDWYVYIQQMEFDPESGVATNYQDLIKDRFNNIESELLSEKIARAQYLNDEEKWIAPLSIYKRMDSEKIATMGYGAVNSVAEQLSILLPMILFLSGKTKKSKSPPKKRKEIANHVQETAIRQPADSAELDTFTYVSHLQPLHIRRGFINLTPKHWPFFALNARTETRPVVLKFGDSEDKDSAVWRLSENNLARLVLSPKVQDWIEENFEDHDSIQVVASKSNSDVIQIVLSPVE